MGTSHWAKAAVDNQNSLEATGHSGGGLGRHNLKPFCVNLIWISTSFFHLTNSQSWGILIFALLRHDHVRPEMWDVLSPLSSVPHSDSGCGVKVKIFANAAPLRRPPQPHCCGSSHHAQIMCRLNCKNLFPSEYSFSSEQTLQYFPRICKETFLIFAGIRRCHSQCWCCSVLTAIQEPAVSPTVVDLS